MFCEKCEGLLLPKDGVMACARCGHTSEINEDSVRREVKLGKKKEKVLVLDEDSDIATLPVIRVECEECGNMEAFWWLVQTRRSDEPETRFLRCKKCKHTWREYD
jgi:DNA-directed RNA polymerase subunit M